MNRDILIFYGSYRTDRQGIKLAEWLIRQVQSEGDRAELVDAKAIGLPMLDRRMSDYPAGKAPPTMARLSQRISEADAYIFVIGEYNGGIQPGLKNLVDHFLSEYKRRPAAIASYSAGPFAGIRSLQDWRLILGNLGIIVSPTSLGLARIERAFDEHGEPAGEDGSRLPRAYKALITELRYWADAAKAAPSA